MNRPHLTALSAAALFATLALGGCADDGAGTTSGSGSGSGSTGSTGSGGSGSASH